MFGARVRKRAGARSCCIPAELLAIKGLKEVVFSSGGGDSSVVRAPDS